MCGTRLHNHSLPGMWHTHTYTHTHIHTHAHTHSQTYTHAHIHTRTHIHTHTHTHTPTHIHTHTHTHIHTHTHTHTYIYIYTHTRMLHRNQLSTSSEWLKNEVASSTEKVGIYTTLHGVTRAFLCSQDPATVLYLDTLFSILSVPVLPLQLAQPHNVQPNVQVQVLELNFTRSISLIALLLLPVNTVYWILPKYERVAYC